MKQPPRPCEQPRRVRALRAGVAMLLVYVVASCSRTAPSLTPLSPPVDPPPAARKSSSRASEVNPWTAPSSDAGAPPTALHDDDSARTAGQERPVASSTTAAACRPGAGRALDCSSLAPGTDPACLGRALARRACESWGPLLDPGVAAAWLGCLREGSPDRTGDCDAHRIVRCGLSALAGACVDGSFRAPCRAIAESCQDMAPELTARVCEQALGAFRSDARPALLECLQGGCDTGGFGACIP